MSTLHKSGSEHLSLEEFLQKVEETLLISLDGESYLAKSDSRVLLEAARHLCIGSKAKRARPRLVHAFAEALNFSHGEGLVEIAVAAELIHAASLLHDDVVDDGHVRRGRPTVNTLWGNTVAVLSGDLLLSIAFEHVKRLPVSILYDALDIVLEMTQAAIMEVCQRGRVDIPLSRWRKVAEGKTSALFAWCGRAVAHLVGESAAVESFDKCGRHLGVAFQLADDLKDILPADSGKDRMADIRSRNPSYPLLIATAANQDLAEKFADAWTGAEVIDEVVVDLEQGVLATDALDSTRKAVLDELLEAVSALGEFVDSEGGLKVVAWAESLAEAVDAGDLSLDRAKPQEMGEDLV